MPCVGEVPIVKTIVRIAAQNSPMRERTTPDPRSPFIAGLFLVLVMVSGCALPQAPGDPEAAQELALINDPMEPANRTIFAFNRGLDKAVLQPVARAYRDYLPEFLTSGIHNILENMRSPLVFANDILQGEWKRAGETFVRFFVNSTIGAGGFNDMAGEMGLPAHGEDFGQTLAVWGMPEGPFLMLPVFGPSNPRDTVGMVVDFLADPVNVLYVDAGKDAVPLMRGGTDAVDRRAGNLDLIDDIEKSSLDFYASIRNLYRQRRNDEISNGKGTANVPAPGMGEAPIFPELDAQEELSRR